MRKDEDDRGLSFGRGARGKEKVIYVPCLFFRLKVRL